MYKIKNIKNQVFLLAAFVLFMLAMSFAAVPLYKLFCQVTGYGGTPKVVENNTYQNSFGVIKVRFDSSTEKQTPLYFEPKQKVIKVNIGENNLAFYKAKNKTKNEITTMSVFNVTPLQAGKYFNKIDCFCFEEQTLSPNQEVDMPVSFFIDPAIKDDKFINDLSEITLSYTMFIR
ncbi:MAG: cytochrome c oxidase assembly protein [Alphaproteobacteria bacterium]|nr:cytochrome c oxidase assembly protein [Alphaproteobacteria bacterium]